jgi:hypothetical protein
MPTKNRPACSKLPGYSSMAFRNEALRKIVQSCATPSLPIPKCLDRSGICAGTRITERSGVLLVRLLFGLVFRQRRRGVCVELDGGVSRILVIEAEFVSVSG